MAVARVPSADLVRLLNEARRPIYVLDEELTLVFLNRACHEWLGAAAEGLLGRRCVYHSAPLVDAADMVAAALCPPPACLAGEVVTATVAPPDDHGQAIARPTRFVPIGLGGDDVLGVLAVVDLSDRPVEAAAGPASEAAEAGPLALHEAIRRFRHEAASRYRADLLIGQGHAMRLARRQADLAATARSSVLLIGPPGSGRRRMAAAIHYGSDQVSALAADSPFFIPLDCSLLGGDVLAAAGAAMTRAASRGEGTAACTLLFHRVDELVAEGQVQLNDFLSRPSLRARLMATAGQSLVDLARRGAFHADLAAMLSTITIELPRLSERRDDLPMLAQLFLEERNATTSHQVGGFSPAALDRLDSYAWPGNLDELNEVVAESHRRAEGAVVEVKDLPERLHLAAQAAAQPRRTEETIVLDEYLGRVERELIRRALARAKGNKARAARLLGVTRPRLYRRMVQLGLE